MLSLAASPTEQQFGDGTRALYVHVASSEVPAVALELALLYCRLSDQLAIGGSGETKVFVDHASDTAARFDADTHVATLTTADMEYLLSFLLSYYRDGVASVDHVDISLGGSPETTLVLRADEVRPPMPGDEARKLLGRS